MMIKYEEKREPFPWKYGILYVNREVTGPNIKVYQTEKDRDEEFNKAIVTLKIKRPLDPDPTEIKSMVKVMIQGDTYKAVE